MGRRKEPKVGETGSATDFGDCPDCGKHIAVLVGDGWQPEGVVHAMPMCERYDKMDASAYLRWVMDVRGAKRMPEVSE